jgi:hypothetical protein
VLNIAVLSPPLAEPQEPQLEELFGLYRFCHSIQEIGLPEGLELAVNVTASPTHAMVLLTFTEATATTVTSFCAVLVPQAAVTVFVPGVLQFVVNCEPLPVDGVPPPLHVTVTYGAQFSGFVMAPNVTFWPTHVALVLDMTCVTATAYT